MSLPPPTARQARVLWLAMTTLAVGVLIAMLAMFIWGLGRVLDVLAPVLWPLAIGGVLAYLLDPVVDFLERRKVARQRAIILVFAGGTLLVAGGIASLVPRLVYEARDLIATVPAYTKQIQNKAHEWIAQSPWAKSKPDRLETNAPAVTPPATQTETNLLTGLPQLVRQPGWEKKLTDAAIGWLSDALPKFGKWILSQASVVASWAGVFIGLAMAPIFAFYFLQEKKGIKESWTDYLPLQESKLKEELVFVLNAINDYLIVFFRGQVVVAACKGVMIAVSFLVLGLDYAVLLGVVAGTLSVIPYLGAILTIVPSMILAGVQFHDWLHPLLIAGVFALVEAIDGFVISPKILGDRVGLHPLTIIIALMVGTSLLGGVLGGVLAIPFTAALRVVMFRYVWRKQT